MADNVRSACMKECVCVLKWVHCSYLLLRGLGDGRVGGREEGCKMRVGRLKSGLPWKPLYFPPL